MTQELKKPSFRSRKTVHKTDQPILQVDDLTLRYDSRTVLEDITFHLHTGERIAVVGPNGAGKSTLFQVIAGVLSPTSGSLNVYGEGPGGHTCIAYVSQRSQVDWNFPVTVAEVVMMGRVGKLGLLRWPRSRDWAFVRQALADVGLTGLAARQINELSGGQQQRMFIARALAQEAELLLLDEPLTGLDLTSQQSIFDVLDELRRRRVTVMVATHDLDQAAEHFDRVMLLNRRLLGFGAPEQVFTARRLIEAYGGNMRLVHVESEVLALTDTCCDEGEH